jgi:5,10-methylenetetrahydromethanopterin reductase
MTNSATTTAPARPLISCVLPPSRELPEYAQLAESLGYERLWVFDSPALYGDVWMAIGRAAEATERIGLGTGVAVPWLRHVMVTASAIASVEELAPGRLVAAFGTGFTASIALGHKPMRWVDLVAHVTQLRGLLRGEVVEVDGAACEMIHSPGFAPPRPINTPLLLAPIGPKGFEYSRTLGDGVVLSGPPPGGRDPRWGICAMLIAGSVLDPGEDHTTPRVRDALGPGFATGYHVAWEWDPESVDQLPGGKEWRARVEERPPGERHLAVHEGHLVAVNERDQPLVDAAGPRLLSGAGWTGPADEIPGRLEAAAAGGVLEVMYNPAGPDIARELEAFAAAAQRD